MSKRFEHQIDEALLLVATQAGLLYVQRRTRRVFRKITVGATVATGVGVATATVAAGIGAIGLVGGAVTWYRRRANSQAPPAS
jgi:tetrahydromethanopterin S-methyltransferase subunit D